MLTRTLSRPIPAGHGRSYRVGPSSPGARNRPRAYGFYRSSLSSSASVVTEASRSACRRGGARIPATCACASRHRPIWHASGSTRCGSSKMQECSMLSSVSISLTSSPCRSGRHIFMDRMPRVPRRSRASRPSWCAGCASRSRRPSVSFRHSITRSHSARSMMTGVSRMSPCSTSLSRMSGCPIRPQATGTRRSATTSRSSNLRASTRSWLAATRPIAQTRRVTTPPWPARSTTWPNGRAPAARL